MKVVIDSTFASPASHRALDEGADYVIHSATKFLGGHNDLLAGCAVGSAENIAPVREAVGVLGGILDAHTAYLLLRGLKTLSLRMERHNANALRGGALARGAGPRCGASGTRASRATPTTRRPSAR